MTRKTYLGKREQRFFSDNGYLLLEKALSDRELQTLRIEADQLLDFLIDSSRANRRPSRRIKWSQSERGTPVVTSLQAFSDLSLVYNALRSNLRLTGPMLDILGDQAGITGEELFFDLPFTENDKGLNARKRSREEIQSTTHHQIELSTWLFIDDGEGTRFPIQLSINQSEGHGTKEIDIIVTTGSILFLSPNNSITFNSMEFNKGFRRIRFDSSLNPNDQGHLETLHMQETPWEISYLRFKDHQHQVSEAS